MEIMEKILKDIRLYCSANGIEDVDSFAARCLAQGFNIVRYGVSPMDNIERQMNGTKDLRKENEHEAHISGHQEGKSSSNSKAGKPKEEEPARQEGEEQKVQSVKRKVKIVKRS